MHYHIFSSRRKEYIPQPSGDLLVGTVGMVPVGIPPCGIPSDVIPDSVHIIFVPDDVVMIMRCQTL